MSVFTVPGKVFLIGEYSVLQGGSALLAALRPGYVFDSLLGADFIHPESPLGRYSREREKPISLSRIKPSMPLGFGSSTAELIAGVYSDLDRVPETTRLWAWYKDCFPILSGADLVVQLEALKRKQNLFEFDQGKATRILAGNLCASIQVIQNCGEKLKTHEALKEKVPELNIEKLTELKERVRVALLENNLPALAALSEFADVLNYYGLETKLAHEIRMALSRLPGVVGVKGCGAGLQDVFLVAGNPIDLKNLDELCLELGLHRLGSLLDLLW